jgi:8-oxo-dGTP pyrophosphatase MutT (NUDIX family)
MKGAAGAAILILLRDGPTDVESLMIERTVRPDDLASGHVALPGGRVDPDDSDLRATALRELGEEVGLGHGDLSSPVRFVGIDRASVFRLDVGVFAAELGAHAGEPRAYSPREVAHVFWLPMGALAETRRVLRDTHAGPREVPATVYRGHVLWGFTRRVLRHFFAGRALSDPDPDDTAFATRNRSPDAVPDSGP